MLRLRAFRPTNEKVVRLELHPTQPWLATADASDNVVVWNWEHRQVVYELNAGGVDARRLVGAKLQKLAEGEPEPKTKITEAIRGGSVKQIKFYDEDVRFWHAWFNRAAAAEASVAANQQFTPTGAGLQAIRGRHFLVICCENKVIFLDMVTMRSLDVPKQVLENKSPLCMEFLPRSAMGEGPLVAFGSSDGLIRVLSMATWQLSRKYIGGHKGAVSCLLTFWSSSGETLLVSGASDGSIVIWTADNLHDTREMAPKHTMKAHDGGVYAIELARVLGGAPQLITIGADKTLAVWDTVFFKELRRIKPVAKVACHSVASWCHPRAPVLDILTCVKDSHIWAVQHSTYTAITRPLCDLSFQVPPSLLSPNKKLKCYCMAVHPLQPHLVATGTNLGVILSEFDAKALPAAVALPSSPGSKEHTAAFIAEKELRLLSFQLSAPVNSTLGSTGSVGDTTRLRIDSAEASQLQVKQAKKRVASVLHDSYSILSVSKSGKYVAAVWPDIPHFSVYRASDWTIVDSGPAKHFAWDSCKERYALIETTIIPRLPPLTKGKKAKEAAAQAAAAASAAATAAASATVQVRILLDDGSANQLTRSIEGRAEPVIGLQGGALLGVAYKFPRRMSFSNAAAASAVSAAQAAALSGVSPTFSSLEDGGFLGSKGESPSNFQLYSWETYKPVGGLLPQPEWSAWDPTVEYCALAYQQYVVISSLRPQYRYLGNVAIDGSTGGVWHRRQLFLATPTTIECVFVDAGVTAVDLERKRRKEEIKANEEQAKAFAEHGELALITLDTVKRIVHERVPLRPPMLQVVRLASFQHAPTIPLFMAIPKQSKIDIEDPGLPKDVDDKRSSAEVAVAGGGVSVAVSRLPPEQKRPVGPLVIIGVRDGVLWMVDRHTTVHAIGLGHPGIRCRCLAAYGDAISAVKWATRLGREHHDDLAQFMLGMGYATEALHLPGISKRLEFELALQSNDLKRALQCLLTLSNSKNIGQDTDATSDVTGILSLPAAHENMAEAVQGIIKFGKEFIDLIDAADATGHTQIASQALRRLAAAGAIKGGLQSFELRGLALRLAAHGELTRLGVMVNTMIAAGQGREAALGAALLGDSALLEKSWKETGMYAEAVLHAQAHGRPALKSLLQSWNQLVEKEQKEQGFISVRNSRSVIPQIGTQSSSEAAPVLQDLIQSTRKPLVEIIPPGNVMLTASQNLGKVGVGISGKGIGMTQNSSQPGKPLLLEGPPGKPLQLEGPTPGKSPELEGPQPLTSVGEATLTESPVGLGVLSTSVPPAPIPSASLSTALSQPLTTANVQQPLGIMALTTATGITPPSDPLLTALSQPLPSVNLQQPPGVPAPTPATVIDLPLLAVPQQSVDNNNLSSLTDESKISDVPRSLESGAPPLAPLVDFLS